MSHLSEPPSPWVERFASFIPKGGIVLDLACGSGRHTRSLSKMGYRILAVDIDVSRMADLAANENIEIVEADLEAGDWPLGDRRFDGIVVTNYLHRPHLPRLVESLAPGGVLICRRPSRRATRNSADPAIPSFF